MLANPSSNDRERPTVPPQLRKKKIYLKIIDTVFTWAAFGAVPTQGKTKPETGAPGELTTQKSREKYPAHIALLLESTRSQF